MTKIAEIRRGLDATPVGDLDEVALPFVGDPLLEFQPVTASQIVTMVTQSSSKSCCLDPIPTRLLKQVIHVLAPPISQIVNLSLASGTVPISLKSAVVTPLLKKPGLCPDNLPNYRPISNLPFLAKLVERSVAAQTVAHFNDNELFVPVQSAYRSGHSTETALVRVFNDLLLSVDMNMGAAIVLLDLSAAFDTVDHNLLLSRLSSQFGISGSAINWFNSYLSDRSQVVSVNGVASTRTSVLTGVPQGSVLGPLLFTAYKAPVFDIARRHGICSHFYADDTQFYVKFPIDALHVGQMTVYCQLCGCLDETRNWMTKNRLKLNDDKADLLLV